MGKFTNSFDNRIIRGKQGKMIGRAALLSLGIIAAIAVFILYVRSGLAMETVDPICGREEHSHDSLCYEKVLVCELEGETTETISVSEESTDESETTDEATTESPTTEALNEPETTDEATTETPTTEASTEPETVSEESVETSNNLRVPIYNRGILSIGNMPLLNIIEDIPETEELTTAEPETTKDTTTVTMTEPETTEEPATERHIHTDACYELRLICEKPEHTHTAECYPAETTEPEVTLPDVGDLQEQPTTDEYDSVHGDDEILVYCHICDAMDIQHGHADASELAPEIPQEVFGIAPMLGLLDGVPPDSNLYNFMTGVVIRDSNGQAVTNGQFFYGETYTFSMSFKEAVNQFSYYEGNLHYTLPPELKVIIPVTNGEILFSNGMVAGWYDIDIDGNVYVRFDNVDNQGNPITQNFIDRYQNVTFMLDVNAKFTQGASTGKIMFGAEAEITVNSIKDPPAGLKVDKEAAAFNGNTESVDFTIVITAVGGAIDQIKLGDVLKITGSNILSAGFPIPASYFNGVTFQYQINGAGSWTITPTLNGNVMSFDFGSLILQKDNYITLKYTIPLGPVLDHISTLNNGSNKYIQRLMYDLTLTNTATATGNDKSVNNPVTGSDETKTPMKKEFIIKNGEVLSNNQIRWTAVAGDGSKSLNGMQITDTMPANPAQTIIGDIQVKVWGYSNGQFTNQTPLNASQLSGILNQATNGFTFDVPASGFGSVTDVRRIEFVYTTNVEPGSNYTTYTNELSIITNGGNKSTGKGGAGIGVSWNDRIDKTSKWITSNNGTVIEGIEYTITVTVPAGNNIGPVCLLERFDIGASTRVKAAEFAEFLKENATVSIYPNDPNFVYNMRAVPPWDVFIDFGNTGNPDANTIWAYADERVITMTYTVPLDKEFSLINNNDNSDAGKTTLRKWLSEKDNAIDNLAGIIVNYWSESGLDEVYDAYPIFKETEQNNTDSMIFDYTVYVNPKQTNQLFADTDKFPALFEDSFDSKLEYVDKSFYVIVRLDGVTGSSEYGPYETTKTEATLISSADVSEIITKGNGSISVDLRDLRLLESDTIKNDSDLITNTMVISDRVNRLTLNYNGKFCSYEIHYQLRVKEEYKDDEFFAQNTATVYPTNPDYKGKFSDDATVKYGTPPISKDISEINGNVVDVDIVINEIGKKLIPNDEGVDQTKFTAVDTMSGDLAFYLSTIEIYTKTWNGGAWVGDYTEKQTISDTPGALWSINYIDEQTVKFVLPDTTPIKIVYKALITVPVGQSATFRNEISVSGYSDFFAKDNYVVQSTGAGAFADDFPVHLFKEDTDDTTKRLSGAEFGLYVAMANNGEPYSGYGSEKDSITVGGKKFYHIGVSAETGNGQYELSDDNEKGLLFANSPHTYLIVETESPNGYKLPAAPNNYTFFVLRSLSSEEKINLSTQLGSPVNVVTDNIVVKNTLETTSVVIGGDKNVLVQNGTPGKTSFTFMLRELNSEMPDDYKTDGITLSALVDNVTSSGTYHFEFDEIENLADDTYWFRVWEVNDGRPNWTYDPTEYVVQVKVEGGKPTVIYKTRTGSSGEWSGWINYTEDGSLSSPSDGPFANGHRYLVVLNTDSHLIHLVDMEHADGPWLTQIAGSYEAGSAGTFSQPASGDAMEARFNNPQGVAVVSNGDIYIADTENHCVRKLSWNGSKWIVSTFAGIPRAGGQDSGGGYDGDGEAISKSLNAPVGLAIDPSEQYLYITDMNNHRIRRVNLQPIDGKYYLETVAGRGIAPNQYSNVNDGTYSAGTLNTIDLFKYPSDIAIDKDGNIYVADQSQNRIRKISADFTTVRTIYGDGYDSLIKAPRGVEVDRATGDVYVSSTESARIYKLTPSSTAFDCTYSAEVWAGTGTEGMNGLRNHGNQYKLVPDLSVAEAQIYHPRGLSIDSISGELYFADEYNGSVRVRTQEMIRTITGNGNEAGSSLPPNGDIAYGWEMYEPMGCYIFRATGGASGGITFSNQYSEAPEHDFKFTKVNAEGGALAGAGFTLYTDAACTNKVTGITNPVTSGVDGIVKFEGLVIGTYYMKETQSPAGYKSNATIYTVEIKAADTTISASDGSVKLYHIGGYKIENEPEDAEIIIKGKKIIEGENIPDGVTFTFNLTQVADADGTPYTGTSVISAPGYLEAAVKTPLAGDGSFTFPAISEFKTPGIYYFKITEQEGSLLSWTYDTTVYIVTVEVSENLRETKVTGITKDGTPTGDICFTNKYDCRFEFTKVDDKNVPLAGAEFTLYNTKEDAVSGSDGIAVKSSSEGTGTVKFTGLKAGIYYMKETKEPTGYKPNSTIYMVTIDNAGSYTIEYYDDSIPDWIEPEVESDDDSGIALMWIDWEQTKTNKKYIIRNEQIRGPRLPETGGNGLLLFSTIGGALLTVTAGAFMFNRKLQYARAQRLRNSMYNSSKK